MKLEKLEPHDIKEYNKKLMRGIGRSSAGKIMFKLARKLEKKEPTRSRASLTGQINSAHFRACFVQFFVFSKPYHFSSSSSKRSLKFLLNFFSKYLVCHLEENIILFEDVLHPVAQCRPSCFLRAR